MFISHEMDENVIQVALYTMREVNGGTEVKLLDQQISDKVPDQIVMADSLDYAGILISVNGIQTFLPYDHARDMCTPQFGMQIAENFINEIIRKHKI